MTQLRKMMLEELERRNTLKERKSATSTQLKILLAISTAHQTNSARNTFGNSKPTFLRKEKWLPIP